MSELKKQTFLKGALIIAITNIIVKIIGALFKIPLTRVLDADGIGIYNASYTIYNLLFVVATAGLPVAISKMVAESATHNNYREINRIYKIASSLLLTVGVAGFLILLLGARIFADAVGSSQSYLAIMALSPCLFFVTVMSVYRGMFQGMGNMVPTALSEFIESCGKLFIGLALTFAFLGMGKPQGAAGAILGVSTGAFLGALFLFIYYRKTGKIIRQKAKEQKQDAVSDNKRILKRLLQLAIPITIGSAVFTLASFIDLAMIMNQLKALGFDELTRTKLYGYYSGHAVTMFNLPPTVITALSISIVPAVTAALTSKKMKEARSTAETAIRITLLFSVPCAVGMSVLAAPILNFAFEDTAAYPMLAVLSYGIPFVSMVMVSNAILQAGGRVWTPVANMLLGGAVKVIVNFVLVGNADINIYGAPVGTVLCYITVALLNLTAIYKMLKTNYGFGFIIKTLFSAAIMGCAAYFSYGFINGYVSSVIAMGAAVAVGCVVYGLFLLVLRTLKREDIEAMPASNKILKLIGRFI